MKSVSEEPIGKVVAVNPDESLDVFDWDREKFIAELAMKTHPDYVFEFAHEIYAYLSGLFTQHIMDSLLREWAFQWWSEETGRDYDEIYNKWLEG